MEKDMLFMNEALKEAEIAYHNGDVPVGAVVVVDDEIVARAHNEKEVGRNPVAHAEVLALYRASQVLGRWRLDDATLYVTLEPCVMCAGAIIQARVRRLVYGAVDLKAGAAGSIYDIIRDERLNHFVDVTRGVLEAESKAILQRFFDELR